MRLKISVLASGAILLDGRPTGLEQIDSVLRDAKERSGRAQVWYYREAPSGNPPPQAMAVVQRIVKYKLSISLSSKPDFSDWVDAKGVSHPRAQEGGGSGLRIPEVASRSDIHEVMAKVRRAAATGGLVILKPDRTNLVLPRLSQTAELEQLAEQMDRMVPAATPRNIAAIANTVFEREPGGTPDLAEVSKAIPFLGILVGLCYIGHAVWIFEGHASTLAAGCREADVLMVDSAVRPLLAPGWEAAAAAEMRNTNILVYDRASSQFSAIRRGGSDAFQFPNSQVVQKVQ